LDKTRAVRVLAVCRAWNLGGRFVDYPLDIEGFGERSAEALGFIGASKALGAVTAHRSLDVELP